MVLATAFPSPPLSAGIKRGIDLAWPMGGGRAQRLNVALRIHACGYLCGPPARPTIQRLDCGAWCSADLGQLVALATVFGYEPGIGQFTESLVEDAYSPEVEAQLARMMPSGLPPIALFRTFVRNLPMAQAMETWGTYQLGRNLSLSTRDREIVIDRTCARCGCAYE